MNDEGLCESISRCSIRPPQVCWFMIPFSLVGPAAIVCGVYASSSSHPMLLLVLTCLATGTFLYVGGGEVRCMFVHAAHSCMNGAWHADNERGVRG